MRRPTQIKDAHAEQRMFAARTFVAALSVLILTLVIVVRLVHLQVIEHERLLELSLGNSLRIEALAPTRGLIYDRNGVVLAENLPAWQLELIPEQVPDLDDTLRRLVQLRFVDAGDVAQIRDNIRRSQRFKPIVLRSRLSDGEIARFAIQRPRFPGVDVQARLIRHYPLGPLGVHAIGYVGALSEADAESLADPDNYVGTSQYGKTGVELALEPLLHGRVGHRQLITNAHGRTLDAIPGRSPQPGFNVHLNLDLRLQRIAEESLGERRGSVVALDPRNGEVLVFASTPGFDPNGFAVGMRSREFAALRDDLDRPLFNRALQGRYPPGSTIKPMLGLAALESHATSLDHRVFCRGWYSLPGNAHRYRDWKPEGHGLMDLHDAISESCDVFFYEVSTKLGIDAIHDYLTRFGLGDPTGLDIPGEKGGLVPSREWKRQNFRTPGEQVWFPGETVIASIGQGYMQATPLQLAQATAAVAMRGERYRPRLVRHTEDPVDGIRDVTEPIPLPPVEVSSALNWEVVINSMHDVLQGERGTARAVGQRGPYSMAGKSGTAQVFSVAQEEEYNEDELDIRLRDHALFVAFAPLEEPAIAVAVIVENGSSGSRVAAPIARRVMDVWLGHEPFPLSEDALAGGLHVE